METYKRDMARAALDQLRRTGATVPVYVIAVLSAIAEDETERRPSGEFVQIPPSTDA